MVMTLKERIYMWVRNHVKVVQQNAGYPIDKWNFHVIIKLLRGVTSRLRWMPE